MKRTLIFTLLACGASVLLTTAAQAQTSTPTPTAAPSCSPGPWAGHHGHGKGGPGEGGILQHLTNALALSGSQQAAIAPIIEAAKPQMKAIRDEAQAKRKTLIDSVSSQITPLLTTDQQTKFAAMVLKVEAGPGPGGPRHFGHNGGPKGPNAANAAGAAGSPGAHGDMLQHLTTELGLTTDQQSQIKPILDAAHTQVQAIRADTTLAQDQKFAKIKDTMEAAHGQINGILTPDQQQKLATMRSHFHRGGPGAPEATPSATPSASPATN